jgi:hypothetical protein
VTDGAEVFQDRGFVLIPRTLIRAGSLSLTVLLTIASANLGIAQGSAPGSAAGQRSMVEPTSAPRFADPASLLDQLPSVAQSSFIQNVLLILLTAAVIGLAAPHIKAGMDLRYLREQKRHKNELSRQSKLIEQNIGLLNGYKDSLWQFYYVYARATYDFAFAADEGKFDQLKSEYEKAVWLALLDFRRTISGAIYLVPEAHYRHLLDLFDDLIRKEAELSLRMQTRTRSSREDWRNYHENVSRELSTRFDEEILFLAHELRLNA